MPQFGFSFECGQKAAHHNTCWISRADRQHAASQRTKVGLLVCNNNRPKAASSKKSSTQKAAFSPPINGTAAGGFRGAGLTACAATGGAASIGADTLCCRSGQGAPDSSFSASEKKQRRKKHFRNKKKRDEYMTCPGSYKPLQEKEDWDEEIQEVTLKIREKMDVVTMPYGPEDMLHFSLRDLTLWQSDSADQSVADNYSPAMHHAPPTQWSCCRIRPESEQFADAEEYIRQ